MNVIENDGATNGPVTEETIAVLGLHIRVDKEIGARRCDKGRAADTSSSSGSTAIVLTMLKVAGCTVSSVGGSNQVSSPSVERSAAMTSRKYEGLLIVLHERGLRPLVMISSPRKPRGRQAPDHNVSLST